MADRQPEIDLICTKLLGWHKVEYAVHMTDLIDSYWADTQGAWVAPCTFDPFTNPTDCAVVMDEVRKQDWDCYSIWWSIGKYHEARLVATSAHVFRATSKISEYEAKMLALVEAIG